MMNEVKGNRKPELLSAVTTAFLIFLMTAFMLWCNYYYTDIMSFRYRLYWVSALIFSVASIVIMIVKNRKNASGTRKAASGRAGEVSADATATEKTAIVRLKEWFLGLGVTWKIFLAYLVFITISTFTSDYLYESFWGNEGRFTGLFLLLIYGLTTALIAKNWKGGPWILDIFCLGSLPVMVWGLTDFFMMDIFHFKAQYVKDATHIFTSSIGNVNNYTAYVGIVTAVSACLFCIERTLWRQIFYYVTLLLSFAALFTGQSDNAWISIGVMFAFVPFWAFRTKKGVFRYLMVILAFLLAVLWIQHVSNTVPAENLEPIDGLIRSLIGIEAMKTVTILFALLTAMVCIYAYHPKTPEVPVFLTKIWGALVAFGFATVAYVFFDANFGGHAERYSKFARYLVFDDSWGTDRGIVWRISMQLFRKMPFHQKLFGFGPDTYGILTYEYRAEFINFTTHYYDAAHNEYIQLLTTIGLTGTLAYIGFMFGSVRDMLKSAARKPWIAAIAAGCLAYLAQATVNISMPIVTPVLWMLIGLGHAVHRMDCEEQNTEASDRDTLK